jgi:hypothetical protein
MREMYPMSCLIRNLASALDDGLTVAPEAIRSHAKADDLLEWLDESFPHHFACDQIDDSDRIMIASAMREAAEHDTGGTYGPKANGFAVLIAWLAYVQGRIAQNLR